MAKVKVFVTDRQTYRGTDGGTDRRMRFNDPALSRKRGTKITKNWRGGVQNPGAKQWLYFRWFRYILFCINKRWRSTNPKMRLLFKWQSKIMRVSIRTFVNPGTHKYSEVSLGVRGERAPPVCSSSTCRISPMEMYQVMYLFRCTVPHECSYMIQMSHLGTESHFVGVHGPYELHRKEKQIKCTALTVHENLLFFPMQFIWPVNIRQNAIQYLYLHLLTTKFFAILLTLTQKCHISQISNEQKARHLEQPSRRKTNWTNPPCDPVQIIRTKDWHF